MLNKDRIELSKVRLEKAVDDLNVARKNLTTGHFKAANNRAYYAMFHGIRAMLALDCIDFKTHSKLIGYFNKNYVHTGIIDRTFGSIVRNASNSRNNSDYSDFYIATKEEAEQNISGAEKLLKVIEQHIETRLESGG